MEDAVVEPSIHRRCLREPIPEIAQAARRLDAAVDAHLAGDRDRAAQFFVDANLPILRQWFESITRSNNPHLQFRPMLGTPTSASSEDSAIRVPDAVSRQAVLRRDGHHCRYCGIPVLRREIRIALHQLYPDAIPWGRRNIDQHAAFQVLRLHHDHLLPRVRGGTHATENLVISCAACHFGRLNYTLDEVGLAPMGTRAIVRSSWDGLERLLTA